MQINYPYSVNDGRDYGAPFWYVPDAGNTLQDLDVPVVTAPYPQCGFYPPSYCQDLITPISTATPAANSTAARIQQAQAVTAATAASAAPAPTPAAASISGQGLAPITLVSPMPSIVTPPAGSVSSNNIPAPASPSFECSLASWVNGNPLLAAVAAFGVYFMFASGGRK